jgi:serine/threonine-protein kinase
VAVSLLCALLPITGCSTGNPPTLPPGASMDGTYAVELGEITGLDGTPLARSGARQTWAIRTACRDSGCVATVSVLAAGDPAKPPSSTGEFDFVDGKWIGVREITGDCKMKKDAPLWMTYSLEPKPDGTIAGMRWEIFANETCMGSRTVAMKRTGDANPAVAVADPDDSPPRAVSPAAGFGGRYRYKLVDKATGETNSDVFYDVETSCLRTGERCLSSFVSESRKSHFAYVFADSKWVTNPAPFSIKCDDGRDDQRTRSGILTLPDPVTDPFQTLTGTVHSVDVGPCPLTLDLDATVERIGDARAI